MQKTAYKFLKFMSLQCLVVFVINVLSMQLLIAANTNGQGLKETRVTLNVQDTKLTDIFRTIEGKTDYVFAYPDEIKKSDTRVSLNVEDETLENVLMKLCRDGNLKFKVVQKTITAAFNENRAPELIVEARAEIQVSGVVKDETGASLPGVNVLLKGTTTGTTTDAEGSYSITVPDGNAVLVFSFIGYVTQEMPVGDKVTIDITMASDITQLGEVVVVGYGEKKRANLTGAVGSVESDVLESLPITNTMQAIQGVIPGLTVQRASGQPGVEEYNLNVRGFSSANGGQSLTGGGNSPLVLIDGIQGRLELLNPADIESISVLKDGSASIYGARAANGVIIVTTKKGKKGEPSISYSMNLATTELAGMMDTPTNYQFAIMDNEANVHNGVQGMYTPELLEKVKNGDPNPIPHPVYGSSGWMLFFTNTDWRKAVFENGFQQKHTLNFSGGGNNSTYYLSATYADQKGVIKYGDDNNKRYNLRLNYDYDISKRLRLETKVALENQNRSDIGGVSSAGIMYETIFGMPNHPVYTQGGEKYFAQGGWGNAVAQAKEGATSTFDTRNVNTNIKLIVDVMEGLKVNFQTGINYQTKHDKDIAKSHPLYTWDESAIAYYSIAHPDQTWLSEMSSENIYRNFTGYLNYNKALGTQHVIEFMGGASHEETDYDWFSAYRYKFLSDEVWSLNLGDAGQMYNDAGGTDGAISSLFSRVGYTFNDKFLLEANFRYDGSSKFHKDTRWGFFPAVSVGWRLSEEGFISDLDLFDNLKLRASYGETGNQEGIGLYDYIQSISIGRGYPYPFGAGGQDQSAYLEGMVSLDRTWETIQTTNVGLDATLLNSRLDFSFDYFVKRNVNMLIPVTYPSMLGAIPPYSNAGELKTNGFELSVLYKNRAGEFDYSVKGLLADVQNEVVDYGGQDTYVLGYNQIREGYPINTYFAYEFDGLIRTQEELDAYKQLEGVPTDIGIGDARFKDRNGDGKIDPYSDVEGQDGDVINAGNTTPRFTYGLNIDLKWKGFDLGIFFQGVGQRTMFRTGEYSIPWSDWWRQPPAFYYGNTWNEDRPDAEYPRLSHGNIRYWNYQASTLQEINAAYLRLKNLQVGYTLPSSISSKVAMSRARIYFSGFDLWEKHNVKGGWDPESSETGFNYPFQRMYSFGLDVTF
jgi:TonB-linked SusC/RagA family outer membrane protein